MHFTPGIDSSRPAREADVFKRVLRVNQRIRGRF
jgi:hypothetical protein